MIKETDTMIGIFVGAALVYGTYRFSRRRHHGTYGPRCGHGHSERWDPMRPGEGADWGRGAGRRWRMRARGMERMVGWLASRLDATPEQYRVIRNEVEQFADKTQDLRGEFRLSRDDITNAMRGESFDEEIMGESFVRQDDRIREVREQLVGALARIHDVLEPVQRERLSELSQQFGHGRGWR
ncbi:MAG: periplasmic heavy metal sensor [Nannocystaceae bacterium]|nr:periplasmic heavy metal sensor [Nannocystaceae bacterium]